MLTRSALHRRLQRHGISRLPASEDTISKRGCFADTKIGYVHIDSCERRLAEGKLMMFLAIDRVSKFTVAAFHDSAGKAQGAAFLRHVVATIPARNTASSTGSPNHTTPAMPKGQRIT